MKKISNLILAFSMSLFIITSIVKFTVVFKPLYYFDIKHLNIPILSGMSEEEIKLNYDYLIKYNTSYRDYEFNMPTIKSSIQGKIHFEEVRDVFKVLNKINIISGVISVLGIYIVLKKKEIKIIKYAGIISILIPIFLVIPITIQFEKSFEIFHRLIFNNDYWIFDPSKDPVINMLPAEFFLHCGVVILTGILIFSSIILTIYKILKNKR
ncbi:membrane protein [[Clostridium] sordellii]|uniref:Membrane protein n=1 Tax=Paraclostridium sordellii TaxID=1505 RepID=A0ABM9RSZ4_PARSO|nr:TIGR01906 family membrane protein [Paeniclostridium sordellii]CEJ74971.1 putative membrane protein [[Clostridium] sordellii] [Paeniclostridium sordellii]CEN70739.1 membrane protein [[Clostridium] sordellii] [Paeniclostridium sordellii]CEN74119.1 membrane protein [[Clostridium] sordellii] [Paeniclostridium sordellii]CEO29996.1 membrane protein [[Clostridium] sordellii] [Paeniclostridium sordellii]CEP65699.1 membrane protein [[Clostridium] sordellii] [Paeniclostridium sordellii]